MSTPFRLPKLVGRKHVVASAVQEIPQFECNKLHVEKHIGRGSFGEVFLTEFRNTDKEPAEKVVVKRMLEMQDEEDTKRFVKEVQIMNELKHPNIVEFRRVCFAPKKKKNRSIVRLHTSCKPHKNTRYLLTFALNVL